MITAAGIAIIIPVIILKRDLAVKIQKLFVVVSSQSRMSVFLGSGKIKGLLMIAVTVYHNRIQKAAIPMPIAVFLSKLFIYPNILSSGIAPPTEAGVQL